MGSFKYLEDLLGECSHSISSWNRGFVEESVFSEDSVQKAYDFLTKKGFSSTDLAQNIILLVRAENTFQNYSLLESLGASPKEIRKEPRTLSSNPDKLLENYNFFLCLDEKKDYLHNILRKNLRILRRCPQTIREVYDFLKDEIGASDKQILTNLTLFNKSINKLRRRRNFYNGLGLDDSYLCSKLSLLNYDERKLSKKYAYLQPFFGRRSKHLLLSSLETIKSNLFYLYSLGLINPYPVYVQTKVRKKRKNFLALTKKYFKKEWEKDRKLAFNKTKELVQARPRLLLNPELELSSNTS